MHTQGSVSFAGTGFPVLHVICTEEEATAEGFLRVVHRLQEAGGQELAVHLRLPDLSDRLLYDLALGVAAKSRVTGGWCVVNGRPDVGLAVRADAVQLGSRALPVSAARAWIGDRLHIGASVHSAEEALAAVEAGANYVLLGTVYSTPTHPARPGAGPNLVSEAGRILVDHGRQGVPIVAIGGIDMEKVKKLRANGASAIAVRRAVWYAADPNQAARKLIERWYLTAATGEGSQHTRYQ